MDHKNFTQEQKEYLLKHSTLKRWAHRSLEERLQLFKRKYADSEASLYKLRKLYHEHFVRRKVIRTTKLPTRSQQEDIVMQAAELRQTA